VLYESDSIKWGYSYGALYYNNLMRHSTRTIRINDKIYPILVVGLDDKFEDSTRRNFVYRGDLETTIMYFMMFRFFCADYCNKKVVSVDHSFLPGYKK
jgi:hypothetical protein